MAVFYSNNKLDKMFLDKILKEGLLPIPFIKGEYIKRLPFPVTEENNILYTDDYLEYARKLNKELDIFLTKLGTSNDFFLSFFSEKFCIKIEISNNGQNYNIKTIPLYEDENTLNIIKDKNLFAEEILETKKESWESFAKREGYTLTEIKNMIQAVLQEIVNLAEEIKKVYEAIFIDKSFYTSEHFREHRAFQDFILQIKTNIPKIINDEKYKKIMMKYHEQYYNNIDTFFRDRAEDMLYQKKLLKFNIIEKHSEFLSKEKKEFIKELTTLWGYYSSNLEGIRLMPFDKDGILHYDYDTDIPVYITEEEDNFCNYGIPLLWEDYEDTYKYFKKNSRYEEYYLFFKEKFINSKELNPKDITVYLEKIEGNEKNIIGYINSRLIQEYLTEQIYIDDSTKTRLYTLSSSLGVLFPNEFITLLGEERIESIYHKEKIIPPKRKDIEKTLVSFLRKKTTKEKIKRNIQKRMLSALQNRKSIESNIRKVIEILKTYYLKPLALYKKDESILPDKAKNKIGEVYLKERIKNIAPSFKETGKDVSPFSD